ncbi:MAG: hypothetical protein E7335_05455 [Clostridiales bacterium]|nr:hypothetical protein [Clostridiales bacterium]
MRNMKRMFTSKMFRAGGYASFAAAIVLVMAVVLNLIVGSLPATMTQIDVTEQALYTLSDQTERLVRMLDKDVSLYLLAQSGAEDSVITKLLENYSALSKHITVEYIDPTTNPTFFKNRELSGIYSNSILVECGEKRRLISSSEMYVHSYEVDEYSYNYTTSTSFDGENQITSAIHYVTNEELPVLYSLTGHGEEVLSSNFTALVEKENMTVSDLHLIAVDAIPEDADCILINAPMDDISADEAAMLVAWLDEGGSILLITDIIEDGTMPNLLGVAEHMGLAVREGMIIEGNRNMYWNAPYYLIPNLEEHAITQPLIDTRYYTLLTCVQPLVKTTGSEANVEFLLTTSDAAYSKAAGYELENIAKEEGDAEGPFYAAAASTLGKAQMVWVPSATFTNQEMDAVISGANSDFFLNSLNWMCEQEDAISIRSKSLDATTLTLTAQENSFWSIVMVGVIPAAFLVAGLIVWYRRKKR